MTSSERTRHEQRGNRAEGRKEKKNETDDIARPESKQEATAKPYYSRKNAQFRSQPELYKNDRKRDTAG